MVVSPHVWHYRGRAQVRNKDPPSPGKGEKTEIPALECLDGKMDGVRGKSLCTERLCKVFKREKLFLP